MFSEYNQILGRSSGSIAALNAAVAIRTNNATAVYAHLAATAVNATIVFEGSHNSTDGVDGNWYALAVTASNATNLYTRVATVALTAPPTVSYTVAASGYAFVRARASVFTSATNLTCNLTAMSGPL